MKQAVFMFLLVGLLAANLTVAQPDETELAGWREDLAYLRERMEAIHPNLFWRSSEAVFDAYFAALDADLPTLTREQAHVRVMEIVALADAHTIVYSLHPALGYHVYPLRLYKFTDGMFVVGALPPYEHLIGAQVLSIGGTEIETVYAQIETIAPHDNEMTRLSNAPFMTVMAEILLGLGVIDDIQTPEFVFSLPDGSTETVNVATIPASDYEAWVLPEYLGLPTRDDALYLTNRRDPFWQTYIEDEDTLYIQYNFVEQFSSDSTSISAFARQINEFIETTPPARVVLDMRHNFGGNNTTYGPLLSLLTRNNYFQQPERLFLIIGRQTFSAGVNFIADLEQRNPHVIFVGEPTTSMPNLFGDPRTVMLPHLGIPVEVSSIYWEKSSPGDPRIWVEPDIPVQITSEDFFNGRDPVLDAIFAYQS